eukprot:3557999-Rhodomonas_salina.1
MMIPLGTMPSSDPCLRPRMDRRIGVRRWEVQPNQDKASENIAVVTLSIRDNASFTVTLTRLALSRAGPGGGQSAQLTD